MAIFLQVIVGKGRSVLHFICRTTQPFNESLACHGLKGLTDLLKAWAHISLNTGRRSAQRMHNERGGGSIHEIALSPANQQAGHEQ